MTGIVTSRFIALYRPTSARFYVYMELDFRLYNYQLWARFPAYFELKTVTKGLKPSVFGVAYLGDLAALACFPWVWYYLDLLLYTRPTSARFYAYVELDFSLYICLLGAQVQLLYCLLQARFEHCQGRQDTLFRKGNIFKTFVTVLCRVEYIQSTYVLHI